MIITLSIVVFLIIGLFIFRRYFPVIGVKHKKCNELDLKKVKVIDVRDYNDSYKNPFPGAFNIPIAYLNRYYNEIPSSDLHLIACDVVGKNVGVRFLRKKGYKVVGYTIIQDSKAFIMDQPLKMKTN